MLSPIGGQGSADIVRFNERGAPRVAPDISLIGAGVDQFTLAILRLSGRAAQRNPRNATTARTTTTTPMM
jgi:hypothetical protein